MDEPALRPSAPLRRRRLPVLLLPVLLIGAYYGGKYVVRKHVDGVISGTEGHELPTFELADATGERWSKARLLGRPTVLHFFRSYCVSCDAEAEDYRQFERQRPAGQLNLLHVMTDAVLGFEPAATQATIAHKGFARPVLMADAAFVDAFHTVQWSNVTPVTYVVDAQGVIRHALRGKQTLAQLSSAVDSVR